ncbi:hypothetical protein CBF34_00260 [Vagococcus penaei]|uniref:Uncharacterized protein n=1 Tax=Vagococcus penaei TaxID=633807 RepID=A0A1Q2D5H9_9ENTE|nr:hypothetical protein [Vagococcus penaei]AQP53535.1 hypothetical protein BW732_04340 [Vagococcus penaei]RSU07478.1 hypothetical protein CBF34_00260 [Vagococcus penaei]
MKQLYVKKMLFEDKDIVVLNRNEEAEYYMTLNTVPDAVSINVYNMTNDLVSTIESTITPSQMDVTVYTNNMEIATLSYVDGEKNHTGNLVEKNDLTVIDDWKNFKFELLKGYRKVSKVRPKWMLWAPSYELTIFEEEYTDASVGMITGIALLQELSVNSDFANVVIA